MREFIHGIRKNIFAVLFAVALILAMAAPSVFAGEYWQQRYIRFSATAGETLSVGDVACIKSDGYAYKADANDSALRPAVGVIGKGGATGVTVEIVVEGIIAGQTQLTPGLRLYLSETAGAMTDTAPTNSQSIGWVLPGDTSATLATSGRYYIKTQVPVSAGPGY